MSVRYFGEKQSREGRLGIRGVAVINTVVHGSLTEVTCAERPDKGEGNHLAWGRVLREEGQQL